MRHTRLLTKKKKKKDPKMSQGESRDHNERS